MLYSNLPVDISFNTTSVGIALLQTSLCRNPSRVDCPKHSKCIYCNKLLKAIMHLRAKRRLQKLPKSFSARPWRVFYLVAEAFLRLYVIDHLCFMSRQPVRNDVCRGCSIRGTLIVCTPVIGTKSYSTGKKSRPWNNFCKRLHATNVWKSGI